MFGLLADAAKEKFFLLSIWQMIRSNGLGMQIISQLHPLINRRKIKMPPKSEEASGCYPGNFPSPNRFSPADWVFEPAKTQNEDSASAFAGQTWIFPLLTSPAFITVQRKNA